ncbi:hypothetical protein Dda_7943 [Drechslerella dactyloides]|uniref:Uncharacterized protein n=1 Tax=Drechslerella dactyloides TaxID=74499 RepID=A0AAD6ISC9_DREDA|nr:hypothetical protein Dda_7943 [Drechslerella dactyloides]
MVPSVRAWKLCNPLTWRASFAEGRRRENGREAEGGGGGGEGREGSEESRGGDVAEAAGEQEKKTWR